MMSPWEELGIAPTAEASAIRKAYAARLKRTRPEEDPAGFARLRAAYEAALQMAPRIAPAPPQRPPLTEPQPEAKPEPAPAPPLPEASSPRPIPPPPRLDAIRPAERTADPRTADPARPGPMADAALLELSPAGHEAVRNIVGALNRKANFEAARLLYTACEGHLLPLRTEFQLKDRLALALSADEELRTAQLQEIASRFGWYSSTVTPRHQANSPQARLAARIERELAAERAQKLADQPKPPPRPPQRRRAGYSWLGFAVFMLLSAIGGLSGHLPQQPASLSVPATPRTANCQGDLSDLSIDALTRCADAGVGGAQNDLGVIYYEGEKLPQDYARAVALFRAAANQGQAEARRNLAYMERMGLGIPKDLAAVRRLYETGANQGDAIDKELLGFMVLQGEGGPADPVRGFDWIRQAALGRYVPAMAELGDLYDRGVGTSRNPAKAAAWRKAAAEAGDESAIYAYGEMLLGSSGVPADLPEAYRWLSLAAQRSDTARAARAALANPRLLQLSGPQRAAIDALVANWRPGPAAVPPLDQQ